MSNERRCENCEWYRLERCHLEPRSVDVSKDHMCSHFQGRGSKEEDHINDIKDVLFKRFLSENKPRVKVR